MDAVIFYDSDCGLCRRSIDFVMRHDRGDRFRFASIDSDYSKKLFATNGFDISDIDSVVFFHQEKFKTHSDAVIAICILLGFPFNVIGVIRLIPKRLRDRLYSFVATNRKRFFKGKSHCEMIPGDSTWKFLDKGESEA